MILMKENKPLHLPLSWLPCAYCSFPLQFTRFTTDRRISSKCQSNCVIPFPRAFQRLPATLEMKSRILPVALASSYLSSTISHHSPCSFPPWPHCSSHRPGCFCVRHLKLFSSQWMSNFIKYLLEKKSTIKYILHIVLPSFKQPLCLIHGGLPYEIWPLYLV